jgi:hypothetical protein
MLFSNNTSGKTSVVRIAGGADPMKQASKVSKV